MRGSKAPRAVAELKGLTKKNPQRYADKELKSELPLGEPPEYMTKGVRDTWYELQHYSIPGVLTGAERFNIELAANLLAEFRKAPADFTGTKYSALEKLLGRLGYNPIDRMRLGVQGKPAKPEKIDDDFMDLMHGKPN
jgi:hypothetical protein